jgi:hypothetical protein
MLSMHRVVCRVGKELALGTRFQIDTLVFNFYAELAGKNSLVRVTNLMEFLGKTRFYHVKSTRHSHGQFCAA